MWAHKHNCDILNDHVHNIKKLWNMNLLVHGLPGSGKKRVIQQVTKQLCNDYKSQCMFKSFELYVDTSNKKITHEMFFRQNKHIYEFWLQTSNMDRLILRDIIGCFASKYYICNETPINKIIILYNIDRLSEEASVILNTYISQNTKTCRFILVTNKMACTPLKLRGSCALYRINRPSQDNMMNALQDICKHEKVTMSREKLREICIKHECNIYECITEIQFIDLGIQKSRGFVFERLINKILTNAPISQLRSDIYLLLINNISSNFIIYTICLGLIDRKEMDIHTIQHVLHISCVYESRTYKEERSLYHIEACVYKLCVLLHDNTVDYKWCINI